MKEFTITNDQLLVARLDLQGATSSNGLTSVKLHRIRHRVNAEVIPVIAAWTEIDRRCAKLIEGKPLLQRANDKDLKWILTDTPAYECDPAKASDRAADLTQLGADTVSLSVPALTEIDLGWISSEKDIGRTLALFSEP